MGHDVEISLVQFRFSLFLQFVLNLIFCVISPWAKRHGIQEQKDPAESGLSIVSLGTFAAYPRLVATLGCQWGSDSDGLC